MQAQPSCCMGVMLDIILQCMMWGGLPTCNVSASGMQHTLRGVRRQFLGCQEVEEVMLQDAVRSSIGTAGISDAHGQARPSDRHHVTLCQSLPVYVILACFCCCHQLAQGALQSTENPVGITCLAEMSSQICIALCKLHSRAASFRHMHPQRRSQAFLC